MGHEQERGERHAGTPISEPRLATQRSCGPIAAVVWAIVLTGVTIVPGFLVGSLAQAMREDFALSDVSLGVAFAGFWLVGAVAATPFALLTRRIGVLWTLRLAAVLLCLTSVAVALGSHNEIGLIVLVALAGLAPALAAPAASIIIMSVVPARHQALALTTASASPPLGLMGAGAVAAGFTDVLGWRGVILLCAALGLVLLATSVAFRTPVVIPHRRASSPPQSQDRRRLLVLLGGVVLANSATGGAVIFFVSAAPEAGVGVGAAALLVSIASAASIAFRIGLGVWIDKRRADPFGTVIALLFAGAAGYVLLSFSTPIGFVAGALLALIPGWSWVNLLLYGVLGRHRDDVVAPTGMVQTTFFVGSVVGPVAMGSLVSVLGYSVAWIVLAIAVTISALTVLIVGRRLPEFVSSADVAPAPRS